MALNKIAVKESTAAQLTEFLLLHGIPVSRNIRNNREELVSLHSQAKLPDPIYASEENAPETGSEAFSGEDMVSTPFDPKNEKWVMAKIAPDSLGKNTHSAVFLAINGQRVRLRRGIVTVFRERFYRVLVNAKETRYSQATQDGRPTKFSESMETQIERLPHQFLGIKGLVKDGPPSADTLPAGALVVTQ